jgi:hypothetical protein
MLQLLLPYFNEKNQDHASSGMATVSQAYLKQNLNVTYATQAERV